jgi:hypothetical protein
MKKQPSKTLQLQKSEQERGKERVAESPLKKFLERKEQSENEVAQQ